MEPVCRGRCREGCAGAAHVARGLPEAHPPQARAEARGDAALDALDVRSLPPPAAEPHARYAAHAQSPSATSAAAAVPADEQPPARQVAHRPSHRRYYCSAPPYPGCDGPGAQPLPRPHPPVRHRDREGEGHPDGAAELSDFGAAAASRTTRVVLELSPGHREQLQGAQFRKDRAAGAPGESRRPTRALRAAGEGRPTGET